MRISFNPTPTIHKYDRFIFGLIPALLIPAFAFFVMFGVTYLNAKFNFKTDFTFAMFLQSLQSTISFMRVTTLCVIPNAFLFFWLVNRDYTNAARAVVFTTMLFAVAIIIKEIL